MAFSRVPVRQMARLLKRAADDSRPFETIERYWNDPAYAAQLDAEREVEQRKLNARIDASIAKARAKRGLE